MTDSTKRATSPDGVGESSRKRSWVPMQMTYVGHVGEVIKGGGGKLTAIAGDPGEGRKEKGTG